MIVGKVCDGRLNDSTNRAWTVPGLLLLFWLGFNETFGLDLLENGFVPTEVLPCRC